MNRSTRAGLILLLCAMGTPAMAQEELTGRELYEQAEAAFEAKNYDRALELLDATRKKVGGNARLSAMRVRIHYARKDFMAAKEELIRFRRMESSDALYEEMGQLSVRLEAEEDSSFDERLAALAPDIKKIERIFSRQWRTKGGKRGAKFELHEAKLSFSVGAPSVAPDATCGISIWPSYLAIRDGRWGYNNKNDKVEYTHALNAGDTLYYSARPHPDLEGEPMTGWPYIAVQRNGQSLTSYGRSFSLYRKRKRWNVSGKTPMAPLFLAHDFRPDYDDQFIEQTFRRIADLCGMNFEAI